MFVVFLDQSGPVIATGEGGESVRGNREEIYNGEDAMMEEKTVDVRPGT